MDEFYTSISNVVLYNRDQSTPLGAAISIPSNLAEGAARKGSREFQQFLNIAQGSISELDTQIELSLMLKYLGSKVYDSLMEKLSTISKMLFGLSRSLK